LCCGEMRRQPDRWKVVAQVMKIVPTDDGYACEVVATVTAGSIELSVKARDGRVYDRKIGSTYPRSLVHEDARYVERAVTRKMRKGWEPFEGFDARLCECNAVLVAVDAPRAKARLEIDMAHRAICPAVEAR
jgi:hypothetical protein